MAEDWAKTVAKKVAGRVVEEAEKAATQRKRFDDGIERFRKQVLDLVATVNANIEGEAHRIQVIVLDNGFTLAAAYRRIVTVEDPSAVPSIPACVGKVGLHFENRKGQAPEPRDVYLTSAGAQTTFYHHVGKDLKIMGEAEFRQLIEYFAG